MWKNMFSRVLNAKCKGHPQTYFGLFTVPASLWPFHTVAMDLLGLFPEGRDGNRHIAVITDFLTEFSVAPLVDASVAAVAKFHVREVILYSARPQCPFDWPWYSWFMQFTPSAASIRFLQQLIIPWATEQLKGEFPIAEGMALYVSNSQDAWIFSSNSWSLHMIHQYMPLLAIRLFCICSAENHP